MRYSRLDQVKGVVGLKIFHGFWIMHVPKPEPRVNTGLTVRRYFFGLLGAVGVGLYIVSPVWLQALIDDGQFRFEYIKEWCCEVCRSTDQRAISRLYATSTSARPSHK